LRSSGQSGTACPAFCAHIVIDDMSNCLFCGRIVMEACQPLSSVVEWSRKLLISLSCGPIVVLRCYRTTKRRSGHRTEQLWVRTEQWWGSAVRDDMRHQSGMSRDICPGCLETTRRFDVRQKKVGVAGFEPTTSSSRTKRATKLRHTPMPS
jgi:hypothetical protein